VGAANQPEYWSKKCKRGDGKRVGTPGGQGGRLDQEKGKITEKKDRKIKWVPIFAEPITVGLWPRGLRQGPLKEVLVYGTHRVQVLFNGPSEEMGEKTFLP